MHLAAVFLLLPLLPIVIAEEIKMVPLCECGLVEACTLEASKQLDNCKKECASWLSNFADSKQAVRTPFALTECFMKDAADLEAKRVTKCLQSKISNFCGMSEQTGNTSKLPNPDYSKWMESTSNSSFVDVVDDKTVAGGTFIKKARSAFRIFRNFQKCMNNCAKRHYAICFQKTGCTISLPLERNTSASIYNECTLQNAHRDARESCRCLIQSHKIYQLIGVCPLLSNTYLMRML